MDRDALLLQLRAVRAAASALVQQVDGIAASLGPSPVEMETTNGCPHRSRKKVADFDDPERTMCEDCGEIIPGSPRETAEG
jgi:hypothetical protein